MDHKDAPKDKMGLVYMLQGGSDASNDDPIATTPPPGQKWVTTGPHVMVVGMAGTLDDVPRSPDDTRKPFIMWGGYFLRAHNDAGQITQAGFVCVTRFVQQDMALTQTRRQHGAMRRQGPR